MNPKRFWLAAVVIFVAFMVMDMIVHGVLLSGLYEETASAWRPEAEMQRLMPIMWVTTLVLAIMFVVIFLKGYENKGIAEGIRYGTYIGLLLSIPMSFGIYAICPILFRLALYWFIASMVEMIIAGTLAAVLYRPREA
ncbi:MAG: hypothetical protein KAW17_07000 [Candidatus Eisenbacteria sp.]|nr:hypothetical protein [Candidatus Eisenbacteria bacterium]